VDPQYRVWPGSRNATATGAAAYEGLRSEMVNLSHEGGKLKPGRVESHWKLSQGKPRMLETWESFQHLFQDFFQQILADCRGRYYKIHTNVYTNDIKQM
jgi:hypothetical protein